MFVKKVKEEDMGHVSGRERDDIDFETEIECATSHNHHQSR